MQVEQTAVLMGYQTKKEMAAIVKVKGEGFTIHSPAKVNLFLAVTGKRADGFHDLVSVVAPVAFGDELEVYQDRGGDTLELVAADTNPHAKELPTGEENLVLKAAHAYRKALSAAGLPPLPSVGLKFRLSKAIPYGAGLGGGSSNAVAALRLLQKLASTPLDAAQLHQVAQELGSDCPLFLADGPVVMRGRGERLAPLSPSASERLKGIRILLFKPPFGIPTPWAYQQLAVNASYDNATDAERKLADWQDGRLSLEELLYNRFEEPLLRKFMALRVLFDQIHAGTGKRCLVSGSGSCCFVIDHSAEDRRAVEQHLCAAFGHDYFLQETNLAC